MYKSDKKSQAKPQNNHHYIKHPVNLRADAAWVLYQILENGQSSRDVMPKVWSRHDNPKDRAWLQQVVFGCLRNLPLLQTWIRQLLDKPLKKQQKIIEHLVMVGLYQIAFARTADHAAVSETVNACKQMQEIGLSKLVNAVLRNFQREDLQSQEINEPHVRLGLPKWIYRILHEHYPSQLESMAQNMQTQAALWLRINTQQISLNDYAKYLEQGGYEFSTHKGNAIKLNKAGEITKLPGYDEGWFAVQDYAAQQAARLLDAQVADIVLDCCAAPGGKTASILELQPHLQHMYALDSEPKRVLRISENLERLQHAKTFADKFTLITADARQLASNSALPECDRILLDAPCSATGVIRRHPDIMWLRKPSDIDVLVQLQAEILQQAWQKLKVGGTLLYATCSILPQENQLQIEAFLAQQSDAKLVPIEKTNGDVSDYWQILPGEENMDGFFYARLLKC